MEAINKSGRLVSAGPTSSRRDHHHHHTNALKSSAMLATQKDGHRHHHSPDSSCIAESALLDRSSRPQSSHREHRHHRGHRDEAEKGNLLQTPSAHHGGHHRSGSSSRSHSRNSSRSNEMQKSRQLIASQLMYSGTPTGMHVESSVMPTMSFAGSRRMSDLRDLGTSKAFNNNNMLLVHPNDASIRPQAAPGVNLPVMACRRSSAPQVLTTAIDFSQFRKDRAEAKAAAGNALSPPSSKRTAGVPYSESALKHQKQWIDRMAAKAKDLPEPQAPECPHNFGVTMGNLSDFGRDLRTLPQSIQHACSFLTRATIPSKPKQNTSYLPPAESSKMTLVLDLDETLVHCSTTRLNTGADPSMTVRFDNSNYKGYVYFRPLVMEFLTAVAKHFEIVVFTASTQNYADQVLNVLDSKGVIFSHRLYRQHCTYTNGLYLKDLRLLGRPLDRIMLADNSPICLAYQLSNGIPVEGWVGDRGDTELLNLMCLLNEICKYGSVTPFLRRRYGLETWLNSMRVGLAKL